MELDDLRQQWQQAEPPASEKLDFKRLDSLSTRQTGSLLLAMRRSARLEMLGAIGFAALTVGFIPSMPEERPFMYGELVLALGVLGYCYWMLKMLRQMIEITGSVRGYLLKQCHGLRRLLHFYRQLSLISGPVAFALMLASVLIPKWIDGKLVFDKKLLIFSLSSVVVGIMCQLIIMQVTPWYMQRRYGQYLDRLEGQLRELDDNEPPANPGSAPDFTS